MVWRRVGGSTHANINIHLVIKQLVIKSQASQAYMAVSQIEDMSIIAYIPLTCHCVEDHEKLVKVILGVAHFPAAYTVASSSCATGFLIREWDLEGK